MLSFLSTSNVMQSSKFGMFCKVIIYPIILIMFELLGGKPFLKPAFRVENLEVHLGGPKTSAAIANVGPQIQN